jgi:cytochrome c-type biogenesis protein CcmH/NrfG
VGLEAYFRRKNGEIARARDTYRKSLAIEPDGLVYARLSNTLVRLGDLDGAIHALREGIEFDPNHAHVRFFLGRYLRMRGDLDEATAVLEALLEDEPDHAPAWANVGRIRTRQGDIAGAETAFRHAIRFDPDNVEARFMLARIALRRGESATLEEYIRQIEAIESRYTRGVVPE